MVLRGRLGDCEILRGSLPSPLLLQRRLILHKVRTEVVASTTELELVAVVVVVVEDGEDEVQRPNWTYSSFLAASVDAVAVVDSAVVDLRARREGVDEYSMDRIRSRSSWVASSMVHH